MLSESSRYARRFWWLITGVALVRVIYVSLFPFDLSGDEAYYWDWGRQLSWGYFSKPPFIAWLMAFAGWLGGNTDVGIRLMAVALGTGTVLFAYFLAKKLWGTKAGFWAALVILASPGNVALNLILTIDAPLMFFWAGTLYFFYGQIHERDHQWFRWSMTTLFVGLGLLSKQMMFAFFPLAILYLAIDPGRREHLKKARLWISWLIACAFLVPTLIWNAQNGWITADHTQHHFEGKPIAFLDILSRIGEFAGSQLGVLSPVTAVAVGLLSLSAIKRFRTLDHRANYLVVFSLPGLLLVCLMLIRQSINPNWPAVFYSGILVLLGAAFAGEKTLPATWVKIWPKWRLPCVVTGAAFAILVMLTPFVLEWTGQTGAKWDPVVRLEGWSELAAKVQRSREIHGGELDDPFILATGHRYTTSHLAFYLVDQPRVYHWPENPGSIESQYELWGFPDSLSARDAFIVVPGEKTPPPDSLFEVFESIEPLDNISVTRSAKRTRHYTLYIGKRLQLSSTVSEVVP